MAKGAAGVGKKVTVQIVQALHKSSNRSERRSPQTKKFPAKIPPLFVIPAQAGRWIHISSATGHE
jgi:hypothetical protein